jgi:thioredoxin 1
MKPSLFVDLSFDAALERAQGEKKILLVDATADWCQPCKHMDKTTWVDAGVTAAVAERAVAIQFDVDQEKELSKKLGVKAMPTVIAFRDGKEIDRVVGVQAPAAFVTWLDAIERGETSLDLARKAAREKPGDVQTRMLFARSLLEHGELDEATGVHEALWKDLDATPAFVVVKHAMFQQQITDLVRRHPPAYTAFTRVRDAATPGSRDWLTLNRALNEPERTLAWFDTIRDRLQGDAELAGVVEGAVVPLLVAAGRWADAGHAFADPMRTVTGIIDRRKRAAEAAAKLPKEQADQVIAMIDMMNAQEVTTLRRALSAAGREGDLRAVEEAGAKVDPAWVAPLPK